MFEQRRLVIVLMLSLFLSSPLLVWAQDGSVAEGQSSEATAQDEADDGQSREAMALDSTATQWSFQFAYQNMPNYYTDTMDDGITRPTGNKNYWQFRMVAPIPKSKAIPFTLLPRLTIREEENQAGQSGLGQTELFVLGIAQDWGTGRWGVGPLVLIPGESRVAKDTWGYGLAGAIVNSAGPWFYGLLLTQAFEDKDGNNPTKSGAAPLGIAPILNYQLGKGWYVGNGDMVARWDWDTGSFYLPLGVRAGKVFVQEKASWNLYAEYQTSLVYKSWPGAAVRDSWRLNLTYTIPVGM